jgi:hypothetical protein
MLSQHIEGRVLNLVERILNGARIEDFRVECKGAWPPAAKAARQIAGHANAARGEPILWIIGLDEEGQRVNSVSDVELADWWAQVTAAYDERITPGLTSLIVPVSAEQSVVALYMTTERAPYVIKRQDGQGPFEREVPWREGNGTRSTHRHELLRLLIAAVAPPDATVVKMTLRVRHHAATEAPRSPERLELILWGTVFFGPPTSPVVVLPAHLMTGEVNFAPDTPGMGPLGLLPITVTFVQRTVPGSSGRLRQVSIEPHPLGVDVRLGDVYVAGPGTLNVRGTADLPITRRAALLATQRVAVRLTLPVAGGERPVSLSASLERTAEESGDLVRWADT